MKKATYMSKNHIDKKETNIQSEKKKKERF